MISRANSPSLVLFLGLRTTSPVLRLPRGGNKYRPRIGALIECVNDQLKNISQIEHTRHRSPINGIANMITAIVAYTFQPKKPALDLFTTERGQPSQTLPTAVSFDSDAEFKLV